MTAVPSRLLQHSTSLCCFWEEFSWRDFYSITTETIKDLSMPFKKVSYSKCFPHRICFQFSNAIEGGKTKAPETFSHQKLKLNGFLICILMTNWLKTIGAFFRVLLLVDLSFSDHNISLNYVNFTYEKRKK